MVSQDRRFPIWIQLLCVITYFGFDLILRFFYQAVLDGSSSIRHNGNNHVAASDDDDNTQHEKYSKPTFLALCCYMTFFLWGPVLVFPYVLLVRRISLTEYYTQEWCGAMGFWSAVSYTCQMGSILFLGNLGYVSGLRYISVALGSALSQGEAPFTVILSVIILRRLFGSSEQLGIALSFAGIALIAIPPVLRVSTESSSMSTAEKHDALTQIGGILSTLFGAFGFGAYQVFWPLFDGKRNIPVNRAPTNPLDAIIDTFATLTVAGAFLIAFGWILIVFLHVTELETFEVPPPNIRGELIASSVLSAVTDAMNGVACVVATAVVVALSYPLIIPMSVVLQYFLDDIPIASWGVLGWIGTLLVIAGVFFLESNDDPEKEYEGVNVEQCNPLESDMNMGFIEMDTSGRQFSDGQSGRYEAQADTNGILD